MTADKRAFVILGMHRSGTSSVTGALARLGATSPHTLMAPAEDNPRGFWESPVVAAFNDRVLAAGGSAWNDWRAFDLPTGDRRAAAVAEGVDVLEAEFSGAASIVLKDPRICRLFPLWTDILERAGYRTLVISPLRDPAEAAASLSARNGLSTQAGLRLWLRHVLEAEAASRGRPRAFLAWTDFLADWRGTLARTGERLDQPLAFTPEAAAAVDAFLTHDLRRQRAVQPVEHPTLRRAWQALTHLGRHGEEPAIHAELDAVRAEFDAACALFADAPG